MENSLEWRLEDGETLLWQGRPAPRCYTFRHWLQALIGSVLFLASSFWLMVGMQLIKTQNLSLWLLPLPILLVLGSFCVGPGRILLARWRWGGIFYALTDRRLLVRQRLFSRAVSDYRLEHYRRCKTRKYGENLASLKMFFRNRPPVLLECLEYPALVLRHLPRREGVEGQEN